MNKNTALITNVCMCIYVYVHMLNISEHYKHTEYRSGIAHFYTFDSNTCKPSAQQVNPYALNTESGRPEARQMTLYVSIYNACTTLNTNEYAVLCVSRCVNMQKCTLAFHQKFLLIKITQ